MMYIQLFLSFFQISLFSFGGGYAALPLIQGQVVNVHHWLSMTEFTDHHFPDDSGTDCDQCSNFCWDETDRNAGSGCGYTWIYHTILYYRDDHCKIVLKIPGNGHAAGNTWRDQTGGGCTDRIGGNFHFADSILGSFRENGDI